MKTFTKISILLSLLAATSSSYASGRTGSHLVGGTVSHGKGGHYVGGYNTHPAEQNNVYSDCDTFSSNENMTNSDSQNSTPFYMYNWQDWHTNEYQKDQSEYVTKFSYLQQKDKLKTEVLEMQKLYPNLKFGTEEYAQKRLEIARTSKNRNEKSN